MLGLLGEHKPCLRFESVFLNSMTEDVRMQLATVSFDDPRVSFDDPRVLAKTGRYDKATGSHPWCFPQTIALRQLQTTTQRATSATTIDDSATRPGSANRCVRSRETTELLRPANSTACWLLWTITQRSFSWLTMEHRYTRI